MLDETKSSVSDFTNDLKLIKALLLHENNCGRTCEEIRPGYTFQESCQGTVPEAIIAFLDSTDFESAVRLAVSLGGDSDTLACITGGIAEAYYKEIPEEIVKEMWSRLPETFREILREMERDWGYPLKGNVG